MGQPIKTSGAAVLNIEEFKLHSRIDLDYEDSLLQLVLTMTESWTEKVTGRSFCESTYQYFLDRFPVGAVAIELPRSPLISVDTISYIDFTTGESVTMDPSTYRAPIDGRMTPRITPIYGQTWPRAQDVISGIEIDFTAGLAQDDPDVQALKVLMYKVAATLYQYRENIVGGINIIDVPGVSSFASLLIPYSMQSFGG